MSWLDWLGGGSDDSDDDAGNWDSEPSQEQENDNEDGD